jgi:hypothetical protein
MGDTAGVEGRLALVERELPGARDRCAGRCLTWSQANVLSLQGRDEEAVATLQAGLDNGWLDFYPSEANFRFHFPTLRDHPGFRNFMAEVRAHMDREREVVLRDSSGGEEPAPRSPRMAFGSLEGERGLRALGHRRAPPSHDSCPGIPARSSHTAPPARLPTGPWSCVPGNAWPRDRRPVSLRQKWYRTPSWISQGRPERPVVPTFSFTE